MNYKKLLEQLDNDKIKLLLNKLNVPYEEFDEYIICATACHNTNLDECSRKLYWYKDNKFFYCYTHCGGMSIFKFLQNYYTVRNISYNWYEDIYEVVVNCSNYNPDLETHDRYEPIRDRYQEGSQERALDKISHNLLDCFVKLYPPIWLKDRISKQAMDKFGILFSIAQNKIVIPHYDENGNLVGIRGRALDDWEVENVGKYTPVKIEGKFYAHPLSLNLYGLNFNKDNIRKTGICYIFESEKSVLQFESFNRPNCAVAICGSHLNKFAIKKLIRCARPQEIVVCFDKEQNFQDNYFQKLWNMCSKYKNYANFSFIYDRENLLQDKDSPSDKGEEVFNQLLQKRVRIV